MEVYVATVDKEHREKKKREGMGMNREDAVFAITIMLNNRMTIKQINKALASGGNFKFERGSYKVTDTIILRSDTIVECEDGVYFYKKTPNAMIQTYCTKNTTKYNGAHDITWKGGTLVGNTNSTSSNMFNVIHAENVKLEKINFTKVVTLHFLEINSSRNVTVNLCTFDGQLIKKGKEHKECIQIDFANYDGFPYFEKGSKVFDGTHCDKVTIISNTFKNVTNCVGTHTCTTEKKSHKGIVIGYNTALGSGAVGEQGIFAKLINMSDVLIAKNNVSNFGYGVRFYTLKTGHFPQGGTETIEPKPCKKVTINDNKFDCDNEIDIK